MHYVKFVGGSWGIDLLNAQNNTGVSSVMSTTMHYINEPLSKGYVRYIVRSIVCHVLDLRNRTAKNIMCYENSNLEQEFKKQAASISSLEDIKRELCKSLYKSLKKSSKGGSLQKVSCFLVNKIGDNVMEAYEKIKNIEEIEGSVYNFAANLLGLGCGRNGANSVECLHSFLKFEENIISEVDKVYRGKHDFSIRKELAADLLWFVFVKEAFDRFRMTFVRITDVELKTKVKSYLKSLKNAAGCPSSEWYNLYEYVKKKLIYGLKLVSHTVSCTA